MILLSVKRDWRSEAVVERTSKAGKVGSAMIGQRVACERAGSLLAQDYYMKVFILPMILVPIRESGISRNY